MIRVHVVLERNTSNVMVGLRISSFVIPDGAARRRSGIHSDSSIPCRVLRGIADPTELVQLALRISNEPQPFAILGSMVAKTAILAVFLVVNGAAQLAQVFIVGSAKPHRTQMHGRINQTSVPSYC